MTLCYSGPFAWGCLSALAVRARFILTAPAVSVHNYCVGENDSTPSTGSATKPISAHSVGPACRVVPAGETVTNWQGQASHAQPCLLAMSMAGTDSRFLCQRCLGPCWR